MKRRKGSAGILLLTATLITWLILPVASQLITHLSAQQLLLEAGQYLDSQLPQAYVCLDADALIDGQMQVDPQEVERFLRQRLQEHLSRSLQDRLTIETIKISYQNLPYDEDHFLGYNQPLSVPVVQCTATLKPPQLDPVSVTRAAVLYQMPE